MRSAQCAPGIGAPVSRLAIGWGHEAAPSGARSPPHATAARRIQTILALARQAAGRVLETLRNVASEAVGLSISALEADGSAKKARAAPSTSACAASSMSRPLGYMKPAPSHACLMLRTHALRAAASPSRPEIS
eukprot:CAMPEP_0180045528 /NCGR_PEP_ID=MMETSP0984-20121128/36536_1 /TAXON_ID=483367 /ORGANISM="non described non described, Strain CCMP 2436" /LENGTH=133 /DNA_ID=CAMNT_0021973831 /DNA_START=137 /DNA_END=536 /DNA_ORIENTATION=-